MKSGEATSSRFNRRRRTILGSGRPMPGWFSQPNQFSFSAILFSTAFPAQWYPVSIEIPRNKLTYQFYMLK